MIFTTGDTGPALAGDVNADLTGASVELHIRKPDGTVLTEPAVITDPTAGAWSRAWAPGDLDKDGIWRVEAQVTFASGIVQTFGSVSFTVVRQIA